MVRTAIPCCRSMPLVQVLLERGSPHVRLATVFVSHIQAAHIASLITTLEQASWQKSTSIW